MFKIEFIVTKDTYYQGEKVYQCELIDIHGCNLTSDGFGNWMIALDDCQGFYQLLPKDSFDIYSIKVL